MIKHHILKPILIPGFILLLLIINGCAKLHEFEGIFPPDNKALNPYQKIEIVNPDKNNLINNLLENALKAQLTSIEPRNVGPAKSIKQIDSEIGLFNYSPKINQVPDNKIAYLSFEIQETSKIIRDRSSQKVSLKSCNYLLERNPCIISGSSALNFGKQRLSVSLTGKIFLKNAQGKQITPPFMINSQKGQTGQGVDSVLKVISTIVNDIAYKFAKKVIPHKEKIKSEIMSGGDDTSVSLIRNHAYNSAANRLSLIISKEKEPEPSDLYNLGLTYEALTEMISAAEYYQKADDAESDNSVIQVALKRIRRVVPE